jgi:hypothetical protein
LAATEVAKEAQVFAVSIDLSRLSVGSLLPNGEYGERIITREELEKCAIRDAFRRRYHLGIEDRDEELCALFYDLKEAVRRGTPGIELAENIERSPLVDFVESGGPAAAALASAPESRDQEASA